MTAEEVNRILDEEYARLNVDGVDRCQVFATIITLKQVENAHDYLQPIYVDAKQWIRYFFEDLINKDFGYDDFSLSVFSGVIDNFADEQALRLYSFVRHYCSQYDFDYSAIDEKIESLRLNLWKENGERLHKVLYLIANRSSWIIVVALLYVVIVGVCFLPAPGEWMECISVSEFQWQGESWWANVSRFLSTVLFFIFHGETESPIVVPTNFRGVLLIGILEFCFWGIIVNFLYQKILKYLQNLGLSENS